MSKNCRVNIQCKLVPLIGWVLLLGGCASMISRMASPVVPPVMDAFFSECDQELARQAMPSNLKLVEGLLLSDPSNSVMLKALCAGYAGYALLFLEEEEPKRAAEIYLRARNYGLRSLGDGGNNLIKNINNLRWAMDFINKIPESDVENLFWTTLAWSGWISIRGDDPEALAQLGVLRACIDRVITLGPDIFYGLPHALSGAVSATLPPMLGGDPAVAKKAFERAVRISDGGFLFSKYLYAKHGAVRLQDRSLFESLLKEIAEAGPGALPGACLLNQATKRKAEALKSMADELFY